MTETEPEPPSRPLIELDGRHAGQPMDVSWVQTQLERAVAALAHPVRRVTIVILSDSHMRDLHRRHMGLDSTTDVLTFQAGDAVESSPLKEISRAIDADIAICIDEAARQASARGHSVERELLLYALHGLLHCCGYDDHDPADFQRMHETEDRILAQMGIGATFNADANVIESSKGAPASR